MRVSDDHNTYRFLINCCLTTGVVMSPNYPNNYPNGLQQTNTIEVDEGLVIEMQFTAFDVESNSTCVTIKNGNGTTLMEKTCGSSTSIYTGGQNIGSSLPAAVTSTSNTVEIYFHTAFYWSGSKPGWRLTWRAVTPGA